MRTALAIMLLIVASSVSAQSAGLAAQAEQEIFKTETELTDAYLKRDLKTAEKLVADAFVQVGPDGIGSKANLLNFLRTEPPDPTLTLTMEDVQVQTRPQSGVTIEVQEVLN